jgi:predicted FMN-binding regulatory protein PaiB
LIIGKWKVSQNQAEINKQGIYKALSGDVKSNVLEIAKLVKNNME